MKRALGGALAFALVWAGASVAGAGALASVQLDPQSGPPGSAFTASGDNCENGNVSVSAPDAEPPQRFVEAEPDGTWSADFTVPSEASSGDTIQVDATCSFEQQANSTEETGASASYARGFGFQYESATFEVTPAQETTTTTTSTTSTTTTTAPTTPTTQPSETLPDSGVADDVVSTPTLTG